MTLLVFLVIYWPNQNNGENMIYLYLNETQKLAEIVSELVKLNMGVVAELHGNKWHIEVTQ